MTAQLPSREMLSQTIERITDAIDDVVRLYGEHWDSALVGGEPNYHAITNEQAVIVRTADDSLHSSWLCDYLEAVDPASVRLLLARIKELDKAAHEQESVAWRIHTPMTKVTYVEMSSESVERVRKGCAANNIFVEITPLYTHPAPVPAVPDDIPAGLAGTIVSLCAYNVRDKELAQKIWNACRAAMLNGGKSERDKVRAAHAEWSQKTFGNVGPVGPLKHLAKEAIEAADAPDDLSEWADMQFLLWDAQRRAGITDEQINQAMLEKLAVNKAREWPEPKDGEPRLHIQSAPKV